MYQQKLGTGIIKLVLIIIVLTKTPKALLSVVFRSSEWPWCRKHSFSLGAHRGFRVWVEGLGVAFRVYVLGFGVWGLGFGVEGLESEGSRVHWGNMRVIRRFYGDNGKENGS